MTKTRKKERKERKDLTLAQLLLMKQKNAKG